MIDLGIDKDLVDWIQFFILEKKVRFMINEHINSEVMINISIPQNFLVLPILFFIYISGVFEEIEKKVS